LTTSRRASVAFFVSGTESPSLRAPLVRKRSFCARYAEQDIVDLLTRGNVLSQQVQGVQQQIILSGLFMCIYIRILLKCALLHGRTTTWKEQLKLTPRDKHKIGWRMMCAHKQTRHIFNSER
jgi:hypothetical protein